MSDPETPFAPEEIGSRAGRRQTIDERHLRQDLVQLVNETVAAATPGQTARLHAGATTPTPSHAGHDDSDPLTRLYCRIGEAVALAIVDHEDSLHSYSATGARLVEAIELNPDLRVSLRRALGVD